MPKESNKEKESIKKIAASSLKSLFGFTVQRIDKNIVTKYINNTVTLDIGKIEKTLASHMKFVSFEKSLNKIKEAS